MSSTFEVPVIKIILEPHPNAETLSIVRYQGYQIVVKTEDFKNVQLAAFIPPDSIVPDRPEWAWLEGKRRIKVRKFRGEWSHGLLVMAPPGVRPGQNVSELLDIVPYEPPSSSREGMSARDRRGLPWYRRIFNMYKETKERPRGKFPHYDIENLRKFQDLFQPGEPIIITEKIHGANALYTSKRPWYSRNVKVYMRSRTMWKNPFKRDWWQDAYRNTPGIEKLLRAFPGISIYGEVYGRGVQELEYGVTSPHFVGFDVWRDGRWMDQDEALKLMQQYDILTVPILWGAYFTDNQELFTLANDYFSKSTLARLNGNPNQIAEGIVIQSLKTRKILKLVNDKYLEGAK